MRLFYQPEILHGANFLNPEESKHCAKVLRLKEQDQIVVLDGNGGKHTASITSANHKKCEFKIILSEHTPLPSHYIHIAIAPTKNADRIEWFVEKAVELGIQEISFVMCDNSERKHFKKDRVVRKAISAMKQSLKVHLAKINEPLKLSQFLSETRDGEKFIAYVDQDNPDLLFDKATNQKNYTILIGPEGDFSESELAKAIASGYHKVSLGQSRLRTETAGIAACHILNLVNE